MPFLGGGRAGLAAGRLSSKRGRDDLELQQPMVMMGLLSVVGEEKEKKKKKKKKKIGGGAGGGWWLESTLVTS